MKFRAFFGSVLNIIFPPFCPGCRKRNNDFSLCPKCRENIVINNSFFCPLCRGRLPEPKNTCHPKAGFVLAAAGEYQNETTRQIIHNLKYQGIKTADKAFAFIIENYLQKIRIKFSEEDNWLVISVPLHKRKMRKRGLNQAEFIADILAAIIKVKTEKENLMKIRTNVSQTELDDYESRLKNVAQCFALKKPEIVSGKNIIIADDVFTSGATMTEAVKMLKSAGAKKIIAFVVAKT